MKMSESWLWQICHNQDTVSTKKLVEDIFFFTKSEKLGTFKASRFRLRVGINLNRFF